MDLLFNTIMLEPNRWTPDHTLNWPLTDLLGPIDEAGFKKLELWGYHVDRIDDAEVANLVEGLAARSMCALGVGAYPSFHKEGAEDEDEIARVYYPETERLIESMSGAERVVVFDHTVRTADKSRHEERWVRQPVHAVHNDYTERSAPQRVRDFLPADEAEAALQRRFAIIQTWRSIAPAVESEPLAVCDGRTIPESGFIRNQRRYRDRTGETYHITYNAAHRFYYFPLMRRDEALVFKVFDTDASAGVRFTAHTAFTDPTSPLDAKPRESIEMRALVFY